MNIIKAASVNPDFLRRILLLGAVGGAGTGLVQSLLKHRQSILEDDEDDAMADELVQQKAASEALQTGLNIAAGSAKKVNNLVSFFQKQIPQSSSAGPAKPAAPDQRLSMLDYAIGGTGGPLAFLASMVGTRHLYNLYERQELKKKMRDEQEALMTEIEREARSKVASNEPSVAGRAPGRLDLGLLAVLGTLGLTGITTGVLTDQMLSAQFPRVRQRNKNLRVLTSANPVTSGQEEEDENTTKSASELLLHVVLSMEGGQGDVTDAVKAAAVGLMPDVTDQFINGDIDQAMACCKAAASVDISNPLVVFAAVKAASNSAFGPALHKLAAAEFVERCPRHAGEGAIINREHPALAAKFEKLASVMVPAMLYLSDVEAAEKSAKAEIPSGVKAQMEDLLEGHPLQGESQDEATSLVNASGTVTHGRTDQSREESDERPSVDPIDKLMTGS